MTVIGTITLFFPKEKRELELWRSTLVSRTKVFKGARSLRRASAMEDGFPSGIVEHRFRGKTRFSDTQRIDACTHAAKAQRTLPSPPPSPSRLSSPPSSLPSSGLRSAGRRRPYAVPRRRRPCAEPRRRGPCAEPGRRRPSPVDGNAAQEKTARCRAVTFAKWKRPPVSRVLSPPPRRRVTPIHLGPELLQGSSDLPGESASSVIFPLFGLAPGGVYLADPVTRTSGELLPHRFTLTDAGSLRRRRSALCCTCRRIAPPGSYPAPLLCGARTFLTRPRGSSAGVWRPLRPGRIARMG